MLFEHTYEHSDTQNKHTHTTEKSKAKEQKSPSEVQIRKRYAEHVYLYTHFIYYWKAMFGNVSVIMAGVGEGVLI